MIVTYNFPKNIPGLVHVEDPDQEGLISTILARNPILESTPIVGYYANNHLLALENYVPDTEFLKQLRTRGVHFFLYEPMCLYKAPENKPKFKSDLHNAGFYSEFTGFEDPHDLRSTELDSISKWAMSHDITDVTVHVCDYGADKALPHYGKICKIIYDDVFLQGLTAYENLLTLPVEKEPIENTFIMANWRWTPHRCAIAALLTNKISCFSWPYTCSYETLTDTPWLKNLDNSKIGGKIREGLARLNQGAPWALDLKATSATNIDHNAGHHYPDAIVGYGIEKGPVSTNPFTRSLTKYFQKSFLAIVAESRFAQPTGNYSEKSIEVIQNRTPFIVAAGPGTLKAMRHDGYETFSKWWPEDYDNELDHVKRLEMIFDLIREINTWTPKHIRDVYNDMKEVLEYNFHHSIRVSRQGEVAETPVYNDQDYNVQFRGDY